MRINKKLLSFISIFLSILLIGQSCQLAFAKKKGGASLQLQETTVNLNAFDASKNRLVLLNSDGISSIKIKATRQTLPSARAIDLTVTNGVASLIDLGPPHLLVRGTYNVVAKQGNRKLKATVTLVPPTLVQAKVVIPLPKDDELVERIRRYQTNGETLTTGTHECYLERTNGDLESDETYPVTQSSLGTLTVTDDGQPAVEIIAFQQVTGDEDPTDTQYLRAHIAETGGTVTDSFSAVIQDADTNTGTNINDAGVVGADTDAGATLVAAATHDAPAGTDTQALETGIYDAVADLPTAGTTYDEQIDNVQATGLPLVSTELYATAADATGDLNFATNLALGAPAIIDNATDILTGDATIAGQPKNEYSACLCNPASVGAPEIPDDVGAAILAEIGVPIGSGGVDSASLASAKQNLALPNITLQYDPAKIAALSAVAQTLGLIGAGATLQVQVPPAVGFAFPATIPSNLGTTSFPVDFAAGSFGNFTGVATSLLSKFSLEADTGAVLTGVPATGVNITPSTDAYSGNIAAGCIPPTLNTNGNFSAFYPATVAGNITGNSAFFNGSATGAAQFQTASTGSIFAINTGAITASTALTSPTGIATAWDPSNAADHDAFLNTFSTFQNTFLGATGAPTLSGIATFANGIQTALAAGGAPTIGAAATGFLNFANTFGAPLPVSGFIAGIVAGTGPVHTVDVSGGLPTTLPTGTLPTGTLPTGTLPTGTFTGPAPTDHTGTAPTGTFTGTAPTGTFTGPAPTDHTGTAPTGTFTGTAPTDHTGTAPTGTFTSTGTAPPPTTTFTEPAPLPPPPLPPPPLPPPPPPP